MYEVHIKDGCTVNFYQVVEVPDRILKEPAFFRLRTKARESKRNLSNILPFDECFAELMARPVGSPLRGWEEDEQEEAAGGDAP